MICTDINCRKDIVFDLLNESTALNLAAIESDDFAGTFLVTAEDGSRFLVTLQKITDA